MTFATIPEIFNTKLDAQERLAYLWAACCKVVNARAAHMDTFTLLLEHYQAPTRYYHNETHLLSLFTDLQRFEVLDPACYWAVWYHDAIYVPGNRDNEKRSAILARQSLKALDVPNRCIELVEYMVLCTVDHTNPRGLLSAQWFLDADMAILGADPETYGHYVEAVRQEYRKVPSFLFRRGRRAFIQQVLARQKIYGSNEFFQAYEQSARRNLRNELQG